MDIERNAKGRFDAFAWPGGYPIYYLFADNGVCCPACANRENGSIAEFDPDKVRLSAYELGSDAQWQLVACDVHYEGEPLTCEHCGASIESAYGPVEPG